MIITDTQNVECNLGQEKEEKSAYALATDNLLQVHTYLVQSRIVRSVLKFTTVEFKVKNFVFIYSESHAQRNYTTVNQSEGRRLT